MSDLGNMTGWSSFWQIVDAFVRKEPAAVALLSPVDSKVPRSCSHWYTEEIHNILAEVEGRRPANTATGIDMDASAGAFRRQLEGHPSLDDTVAGEEAGAGEADGHDEAISPERRGGRRRSGVSPPFLAATPVVPSTGVRRKAGSAGHAKLMASLEDYKAGASGGGALDGISGSVEGMAQGVARMAQTQDDLKPNMNAALSGIAALTAQQQISAKLNNIQKLNDMKAALSPEVYDKMLEQIMNG